MSERSSDGNDLTAQPDPHAEDVPEDKGRTPLAHDEERAERRVAVCLLVSTATALGLAATYVTGGQTQVEGALLLVSLFALGVGLVLWGKELLPDAPASEARPPHASSAASREFAEESFLSRAGPVLGRRRLLGLLGLTGVSLGVAALFPVRSLGPSPGRTLYQTKWRPGSRLVREDGSPVKPSDLAPDNILTVFPEGHTDAADSQTVLINLGDARQRVRAGREEWAYQNIVAYSKVCTHAGCPVGLYRAAGNTGNQRQLLCPCHQSTFEVTDGCRPIFGPAARSLPQLAIAVNQEGFLVAQHDYTEPVGVSFWNRD